MGKQKGEEEVTNNDISLTRGSSLFQMCMGFENILNKKIGG